jgi:predicted SnoaL-like aldol condensation-catalyzing enzyme
VADPITQSTLETIIRFNNAINAHDLDAVTSLLTDDTVFENTYPAPDGETIEGKAAVSGFWLEFFESSPKARFYIEESFASGERAFVRWRYNWQNADETFGHVRGVDIFRVHNGKIAEKLSYVKG